MSINPQRNEWPQRSIYDLFYKSCELLIDVIYFRKKPSQETFDSDNKSYYYYYLKLVPCAKFYEYFR